MQIIQATPSYAIIKAYTIGIKPPVLEQPILSFYNAMRELDDSLFEQLVRNYYTHVAGLILTRSLNRLADEFKLVLIEYVRRVEEELEREHQAKIELERFKEQIRKEYTGIKTLASKYPQIGKEI